jgi:hypothetical protein
MWSNWFTILLHQCIRHVLAQQSVGLGATEIYVINKKVFDVKKMCYTISYNWLMMIIATIFTLCETQTDFVFIWPKVPK